MKKDLHISALLSAVTGKNLAGPGAEGMDKLIDMSNFVMKTNWPLWSTEVRMTVYKAVFASMDKCKEVVLKQYPDLQKFSVPKNISKKPESIPDRIRKFQTKRNLPDELELKQA